MRQELFARETGIISKSGRTAYIGSRTVCRGTPICRHLAECFRERFRGHPCKTAVAIVEENRYRLREPRCCQNQIESLIAINVAADDLKASNGRSDLKVLATRSTEL